jgi:hypothetical protein
VKKERKKWTIPELLVRDGSWPTIDGPKTAGNMDAEIEEIPEAPVAIDINTVPAPVGE